MSDRGLVAAAVAAFVVAFLAPTGLLVVAVLTASALLLSATLVRRPSLVYVAAVVVIGARAGASVEALGRALPARVDGVASLVADPRPGPFGVSCVVRLRGRLWLAEVDRDSVWALKDLLTGDRVQLAGRTRSLGASNRGWVLANHLAGRISVSRIGDREGTPPWFRLANVVHRRLSAGSTSFGDAGQSLFMGLVVGDDRNQDEVTGFRFRASGLGHLLAVSGQNVAFLLVVFRPLLERLPVRWRWLAVIAVLILFVLVTRAEPSVLRAAAMAGVAGVAASLGRVASGARIVGLSVLGLLLVDPLLAHSVGFQLSLGATIGLLVLARPLARVLPGPRWFADGLAVTLSAQAGTTPILMVVGGGVPSVATVANLLAVPAAGVVMMLGLTTGLAAGFVRADVASALQVPTRLLVWWIDRVAVTASRAPMAVLDPLRLVLVVVAVISVIVANRLVRRQVWQGSVMLAAAALVVLVVWPVHLAPGRHVVDDGRRDGLAVLIDGCGRRTVTFVGASGAGAVLEGLWRSGVVRADVVAVRRGRKPSVAQTQVADGLGARTIEEPAGAAVSGCTDHRAAPDR